MTFAWYSLTLWPKISTAGWFDVLDHQPDGKTVAWANEASGHFGKIKSVATFEKDQRTCRTVRVLNRAGGVTGEGRFDFCRQADGPWKIVP